jgi:hypothetical protein
MEHRIRPEITEKRVKQIRSIIAENPEWNRTRISQHICRLWRWQNPNGDLKDISCRDMLRRLDKAGRISLPVAQKPSRSHGSADMVRHFEQSLVAHRIAGDWQSKYGHPVVLLETFVEVPRFRGTCYKAANWVHVGSTTGRGRDGGHHNAILPIKDIYLYPLAKNFRTLLMQDDFSNLQNRKVSYEH